MTCAWVSDEPASGDAVATPLGILDRDLACPRRRLRVFGQGDQYAVFKLGIHVVWVDIGGKLGLALERAGVAVAKQEAIVLDRLLYPLLFAREAMYAVQADDLNILFGKAGQRGSETIALSRD